MYCGKGEEVTFGVLWKRGGGDLWCTVERGREVTFGVLWKG